MLMQDERLQVPHPRWRERSFVTAPLSDLRHAAAADPPAQQRSDARNALLAMLQQADMQWHAQQRARRVCSEIAALRPGSP